MKAAHEDEDEAHEGSALLADGSSASGSAAPASPPPVNDVCQEVRAVWELAWPMAISFSFQMATQQLNAVFVGHLGPRELGAATLGIMLTNITGFSIVWGGMTALDTLGSQSYGAGNYPRVGVLAQRCLAMSTVACVPVAIVWWYATMPLLQLIGIDAPIAEKAAEFTRWYILALWPQIAIMVVNKFLSMQTIVKVQPVVQAITMPVSAALTYALVYRTPLGFIGAPIAQAVASWFQLAVFIVVIRIRGLQRKCWHGWSREAWRDWMPMLVLGASGTLQTMGGWWSWELNNAMAGVMGEVPLAAHACMMNMAMLTFPGLDGLGTACTIRVGNCLGAGSGAGAQRAAKTTLLMCLTILVGLAAGMWLGRNVLAYAYTNDASVAAMAALTVPAYLVWCTSDTTAFMGGCTLRGAGKQSVGATISLTSTYLCGVPMAFYLGLFTELKVSGLWLGMFAGQSVACTMQRVYLHRMLDWQKAADEARERALREPPAR